MYGSFVEEHIVKPNRNLTYNSSLTFNRRQMGENQNPHKYFMKQLALVYYLKLKLIFKNSISSSSCVSSSSLSIWFLPHTHTIPYISLTAHTFNDHHPMHNLVWKQLGTIFPKIHNKLRYSSFFFFRLPCCRYFSLTHTFRIRPVIK